MEVNNSTETFTEGLIPADTIQTLHIIFYGVIAPLIIGFGLFGNIINLMILRTPLLKGVTYSYLKFLAISDIISCIFYISLIFKKFKVRMHTYAAAVYYAHFEITLLNAFMASSTLLVTVLTVDRFFSVCLPGKYQDIHNKRKAKYAIAFAYITALTLYFPVFFINYVDVDTSQQTGEGIKYTVFKDKVYKSHEVYKAYVVIKEMGVRLIPITTLAVLNTLIIVRFKKTLEKRKELMSSPKESLDRKSKMDRKNCKEERRLVCMLAGLVVLIFIGKTPASIYSFIWRYYDAKKNYGYLLFTCFADTLEILNHCLNFCVYCWCSSKYRRAFISLMTCYTMPSVFNSAYNASTSGSNRRDSDGTSGGN
ncbi:probable G-protein coupled receptor AH9.1 [Parasteatoda tepidariorum]|uniref:probable G-protein coupled receptor AH9.1 n=1 Tax=Parasteatoda tepidariorum TaxID=114398 RepID=UPI00077FA351|nr:probable G-protein coupled receptor AH9.1 [Parasteatoda tepidariorum]